MKFLLQQFILFIFLITTTLVSSQGGLNDPSFNPGDFGNGYGKGTNTAVRATAVQADGKVVIGGSFTLYNGVPCKSIARTLPDGRLDPFFNPYNPYIANQGFNDQVKDIAIQTDQKIIVVGSFTRYNNILRKGIVRINSDGSIDATFSPGTGAVGSVNEVEIQPDGKILIAGNFTTFAGVTVNRIARLLPNGALDPSFNTGLGFEFEVISLKLQADGKILTAGSSRFNGVNGASVRRLLPNGSEDFTFAPTSLSGFVLDVAVQSDGKILAGHSLGIAPYGLYRLEQDGSIDPTFNPHFGSNDNVEHVYCQDNGQIIIMGAFNLPGIGSTVRFARLNSDGSPDMGFTTFDVGGGLAATIQPDGKIIYGGFYVNYQGIPKNNICRVNTDGSLDLTFNNLMSASGEVFDVITIANDSLLIGGSFGFYNGYSRGGIARLDKDGELDLNFDTGTGVDGGIVYTIAQQTDGKVLIGGLYNSFNGIANEGVVRLNSDGSYDNTFAVSYGLNNQSVRTIAIQNDGKIIVGGTFTEYNGQSMPNMIVRLNTDGTLDPTFLSGLGFNGPVYSVKIQADEKIIVGGHFTSYNGSTINRLARLNTDGTLDPTFNTGTGPANAIIDLEIQADGKIVIGGVFTSYAGTTRNKLARVHTTGGLDISFAPTSSNGDVYNVQLLSGGRILVTGDFGSFNGANINKIICLNSDGSTDASFNVGNGNNYRAEGIAIQSDGKIIIGGQFSYYNGAGRNHLARIFDCTPLQVTAAKTSCGAYYWPKNGQTLYVSGNYYAAIPNTTGCDSLFHLSLNSVQPIYTSNYVNVCGPYTWSATGNTYFYSGIYTDTMPNVNGCDSVSVLDLIVRSDYVIDTKSACGPYTWIDGNVYMTNNNTAIFNTTNIAGCDSIITLNLTIGVPNSGIDNQNWCGSFDWIDGNTYTSSNNTATYTLQNVSGCDSVVTLNLTMNYPNTGTDIKTECDSYTWIDGVTYTGSNNVATHTLQNAAGCDSVVTLNLIMNYSSTVIDSRTECDSYTWIDGVTYTGSNNTAIYTVQTATGCDSVVTLNLQMFESTIATQTESALDSYTWSVNNQTYTIGGQYTAVIPNAAGCDSTITLDLTLNFTGLEENNASSLSLYPNPGNEKIMLKSDVPIEGKYFIIDLNGRMLMENELSLYENTIPLKSLNAGTYFIRFSNYQEVLRFIKK